MGSLVVAGPSNTVVVDKQGMYWMAGKVRRVTCSRGLQLIFANSGRTVGMVLTENISTSNSLILQYRLFWVAILILPIHAGYYVCAQFSAQWSNNLLSSVLSGHVK